MLFKFMHVDRDFCSKEYTIQYKHQKHSGDLKVKYLRTTYIELKFKYISPTFPQAARKQHLYVLGLVRFWFLYYIPRKLGST